jgi:dihydrofolate synthase / folylpolyglutamate synthase
MDYQAALDYILKFSDYERQPRSSLVWDLRRIEKLLERLGNPQFAARTVHVAGTKGKGSTSAMIASILTRAGYRTGLYTSPHLFSFTERIQIDGRPISDEDFARLTTSLQPDVEAVNRDGGLGELTTFELLTALAFVYYREIKADFQVMEVGLGGRLDATNVVKPEVCVITNISFDHMDILGDTLAKIATEKAGIIKPGCVVVCSPQFPEALEIIRNTCLKQGVRLVCVGADVTWQAGGLDTERQSFRLKGLSRDYDLTIPLLGLHQIENAAAAVVAVEALSLKGARVPPSSISSGLAQVSWPGRLQVLGQKPWLIVDSAHNAYSIKRLGEALHRHFKFDRVILILGTSSNKDIAGIVAESAALTNHVILTQSHNPRALASSLLAAEFAERGVKPAIASDIASALNMASDMAASRDLVCVTGSVFLVAEAMEFTGVKR